jgi:hypothetical protein
MRERPLPPPDPTAPLPRAGRQREAVTAPAFVRDIQYGKAGDPLAWARRLRAREIACEDLSAFQRQAWREALRQDAPSSRRKDDTPYESTT